jgi:hypothetical protein
MACDGVPRVQSLSRDLSLWTSISLYCSETQLMISEPTLQQTCVQHTLAILGQVQCTRLLWSALLYIIVMHGHYSRTLTRQGAWQE